MVQLAQAEVQEVLVHLVQVGLQVVHVEQVLVVQVVHLEAQVLQVLQVQQVVQAVLEKMVHPVRQVVQVHHLVQAQAEVQVLVGLQGHLVLQVHQEAQDMMEINLEQYHLVQ